MNVANPPFTITPAILRDTAAIYEAIGKLSVERLSVSPTLRRTERIRTIRGTLAIEQNTLSLDQVTAVLNGKHVIAPPRDIAEVKNAFDVYEKIDAFDPFSVDSLLEAHGMMMRGLIEEAGVFRSGAVGVVDGEGNILHFGTLPRYVPESVERLLLWVEESDLPMLIKSSVFHYEFEMIHPFADGNGRMGRFWQTLLLSRLNPLFAWLPVESLIHDRQADYYAAINESSEAGESTAFIAFMLSVIRSALAENGTAAKNAGKSALRKDFVLRYLSAHARIRNADVCAGLNVSSATANRILGALEEEGVLVRVRDGRCWAYEKSDGAGA